SKACKTLIDSSITLCAFEESLTSHSNFLRGPISPSPTILQNPSLLHSMATPGSSDSMGGYSTAFLTLDQLKRFSTVKIKLCRNKVVDLEDLEKHGIHSVVEALQRLKWTEICTVSEPRYPHLKKAFCTCLKTDEDGSLTSMVKGKSLHITHDLLERLFGVSVDIHAKGLGNVWSKTSVAEGEAIIGEASDAPPVQEEDAAVREDEPLASERRIEDIALELIGPVGQSAKGVIPPIVPVPTIIDDSVIGGVAHIEREHEDIQIEETPSIPVVETGMEESHEEMIPEPEAQGEQDVQGETTDSAPVEQFQEGLVEDTSDEDEEPIVGSGAKGKGVAIRIPLLTIKAHNTSRKKKIHVHLEPVIARLNAQGEILCSLQSDVTSIFLSQSTEAKDIGAVRSELQGMRSELGSLKKLVTDLLDFVRVHLTAQVPPVPTHSVPNESAGPPRPLVEESGPSWPSVIEEVGAGPSTPSDQVELVAEPTGP
ncbi:hypothetical protein Taro_019555, partial [Colocasia esculenta]|nr:hypothetical protein [Colocasia esculenta]